MTNIDALFEKLKSIPRASYPESMLPIHGEIPGLAFFPAGKGTFLNDDILSNKDIMILGQDFDSEKNFIKTIQRGFEDKDKNPTWKNLLEFLEAVGISTSRCFFTNSILGARRTDKNTGESPAFKDKVFLQVCQDFFLYQLEIQKPKVILALGKSVAQFLSTTSNDLKCWSKINNFKTFDSEGNQIITAKFGNGQNSKLVLLTHPSYRLKNVGLRSYMGSVGNEAEIKMVKDALK